MGRVRGAHGDETNPTGQGGLHTAASRRERARCPWMTARGGSGKETGEAEEEECREPRDHEAAMPPYHIATQ